MDMPPGALPARRQHPPRHDRERVGEALAPSARATASPPLPTRRPSTFRRPPPATALPVHAWPVSQALASPCDALQHSQTASAKAQAPGAILRKPAHDGVQAGGLHERRPQVPRLVPPDAHQPAGEPSLRGSLTACIRPAPAVSSTTMA